VKSILILDYDEVIYCHGGPFSIKEQRKLLLEAIEESDHAGAHSMIWFRSSLPSISPLEKCLIASIGNDNGNGSRSDGLTTQMNKVYTGEEDEDSPGRVFACFGGIENRCPMRQAKNSKAMHHGLICPFTDNHVSCSTPEYPGKGCYCRSISQSKCEIIHLNAEKCGHLNQSKAEITDKIGKMRSNVLEIARKSNISDPNKLSIMTEIPFQNEFAVMYLMERSNISFAFYAEQEIARRRRGSKSQRITANFSGDDISSRSNAAVPFIPPKFSIALQRGAITEKGIDIDTNISVFYILSPVCNGAQERHDNVFKAIKANPHVSFFNAIYWESDWEVIKKVYNHLKLPNSPMPEVKGTRNRRGKYARWLSILFAVAYAVQFRLPQLLLLEDDSQWPSGNE
jgi:hypothetical protein